MAKKKITAADLTGKCAITGKAKYPSSYTKEEMDYMQKCQRCGEKVLWSGEPRLRGYAGEFICDHCDDNYNDEEIKNG